MIADAIKLVAISGGTTQEALRSIHTDHLNTPRLATNVQGAIVWRWEGKAFGDTAPNEDPDLDTIKTTINLRYPGQYVDAETGLFYNWNRYYEPKTGRYLTSDPIGLAGGLNSFLYANANPLRFVDPMGLAVEGSWIQGPRFNLQDVGVDGWDFVSPSFSIWGYLKFIRLRGHASGYVNIDVKCTDGCKEWEVHDRISVDASGSFDVGPNVYALAAGFAAGPYVGISVNIAIAGAAALQAEYHFLSLARQKAGPIIAAALAKGPTLICLGSR